ncbi:MAG TPA: zinc ribbon domain-containing protein, partial [Candidatus Edwardsbacteria bacterium]|nr:zinc ribbon domain-containing protein [Candidatus Edwardsbacteria bacterium]
MPIYEYRCTGCGHCFEQLMSSSSVKNPACPKCGTRTEK